MQAALAILSGALVGFSLGLIGGGGSILATPLLLYVVGVRNPHVAIGTGALAVAVNAFANFAAHARSRTVRWRSAAIFAVVGVAGAAAGSSIGKAFNGKRLLFLFAILMIVVGVVMLRRRHDSATASDTERLTVGVVAKIAGAALLVGALSGFFGIGGGFLIVPGLIFATGMPMINAVGSSLLSVGSFGVTTAVNYAMSGLIAWVLAAEFIGGGVIGGLLGMRLALRLSGQRGTLTRIFAGLIFVVAAYMLYRNAAALGL
ncbi:MAG TPA: sulfite exporter TauE/SafE family protein [Rhodopila sp.]|nr:sulfite exporter TauE/SafE family protein [Rhodopila sp.]